MKIDLIKKKYKCLREIGISEENSRKIIETAYGLEGYSKFYPVIVDDYLNLLNKNGWAKEKIKSRLEHIFFD